MEAILWIGFVAFILLVLAIDLGTAGRNPHAQTPKECMLLSTFWIGLSLLFNAAVYFIYEYDFLSINSGIIHDKLSGSEAAVQFFTGYLIEKSLSLDNIFVIAMIFSYFQVPLKYQHRVLFWGILGVLALRCAMILLGVALFSSFAWINYVFGAFLIFTAVKMLLMNEKKFEPDKNFFVSFAHRRNLTTKDFRGGAFFVFEQGKWLCTPLFLVLLVIETSDLLFAVDSIPAVFAVTSVPFIIYTSNVFAVLGLRSLYFALAHMIKKFIYMETSLIFVLAFVGTKMLLAGQFHIPTVLSLCFILGILSIGFFASLYMAWKSKDSNSG